MAENLTAEMPKSKVVPLDEHKVTTKAPSELEKSISDAIILIRSKQSTPKDSGIGIMLNALKLENPESYKVLLTEYKEVAASVNAVKPLVKENIVWQSYQTKTSPEEAFKIIKDSAPAETKGKSRMQRQIDEQLELVMAGLEIDENTDPDSIRIPLSKRGPIDKPGKGDKVRVAKVKQIKPARDPNAPIIRDRTAYNYRGGSYGKGQLVLAILRQHILDNPNTTHDQLKKVFPDELLRGYGIFKKYEDALNMSKTRKRYFLKEDQQVKLGCGTVVCVSNQFTSDNIIAFLDLAKKLGHKIE